MAISQRSSNLLWAGAAGICSFPDCDTKLITTQEHVVNPYAIGEMAHIKGENPGSNRHDPTLDHRLVNDYRNLILLCPNHHTEIDKKVNEDTFTFAQITQFKLDHEKKVASALEPKAIDLKNLADQIFRLLSENKVAWEQYGPLSERAKQNPHDERIFATWVRYRLTVIVPNNRKIARLLETSAELFEASDAAIIAKFMQHTSSYESWVRDELPYAGVVRFPVEFEQIIVEAMNAS